MGLHLTGSSVTQLNNAFARLSGVQATATADGALVAGSHNPVDATSGNRIVTLADAPSAGLLVAVSKKDSTTNTVTVSVAHLRDGGAGTIALVGQYEALMLTSKADGTWWPVGDHKTKAYFDATYAGKSYEGRVQAVEAITGAGLIANLIAAQATNPVVFAHRCGLHIFPEETMEAAAAAAGLGIPGMVLDFDANLLGDGAVGIMHDDTVDRTTTSSGSTSTFNTPQWMVMNSDPGTWFAPAWSNTLHVPLAGEILDRFGGKIGVSIEAKTTAVLAPLIAEVTKRGLTKAVIINTSIIADLAAIKAAGIHATYYFPLASDAANSTTRAAVLAAAPDSIVVQNATAKTDRDTIRGWGIPVLAGETNRQTEWATYRGEGFAGIVADDPVYTLNRHTKRTADTWSSKTFGHGFISNLGITPANRPSFTGTNKIQFPVNSLCSTIIGEVSPTAGANKTIDFWVTTDTLPTDTTRYFQVTLQDSDPSYGFGNPTANGYAANFRVNGTVELYRLPAGSAAVSLGTLAGTAWTAGERRHLRLTVSASQVIASDVTSAKTVTSSDTTYRPASGWFLYLGKSDATTGGIFSADTLTIT